MRSNRLGVSDDIQLLTDCSPNRSDLAQVSERIAQLDAEESVLPSPFRGSLKVDIRLPEKGNSNSHGARPVH